ncbi:CDP-alcohol phosphatidyltransferase family protein [Yoonia sp.]|uniref:CDP-alcohol phosphatidyltransferase family protein n=1 Tax=Yoonia sp. TaxID=2212373 RepID=UPI002FDB5CD5
MRQIFLQMSSTLHRYAPGTPLTRLRMEFLLSSLSGLVIVIFCASLFDTPTGVVVACGLYALGVACTALAVQRQYPHAEFGLCNLITMTRLSLTLSLVPLLFLARPVAPSDLWTAFAIAAIALSLDGVDGWTARRSGLVSRFGARFDMEVDSVFALVLALVAYASSQAGLWIVLLGLPRYAFFAAARVWPRLAAPVPDTVFRKAVCVFQIGTLIAFLVPVLPTAVLTFSAALAAAALAWSFLADIRVLLSRPA